MKKSGSFFTGKYVQVSLQEKVWGKLGKACIS